MKDIGRRWVVDGLGDAAFAKLAHDLKPSELWSLLLGVMEQRSRVRSPTAVRQQWESDRFVHPAPVDQRTLHALDGHLLAVAKDFEALELSPLAPLATCSSVALTSQNRSVSTVRGTEVVSDPTNVLALESAQRLRVDPGRIVRLATCHRCVRAQPFPKLPGFAAHFRIFCLTTAGHETKDRALLAAALVEHIELHLSALARLEQHGYAFGKREVTLLTTAENESLGSRIADAVQGAPVSMGSLEHAYYDGLRFRIDVGRSADETLPLIDGGAFNWLHALTANHKMSFVASGMGAQLAACLFRAGAASASP
jgi:hypothetical protein